MISLVRPDGSGLRRLSPPNLFGVVQGLSWSPGGSRIAVSGDFWPDGGRLGWLLLTMDRDDGDTRVLARQSPDSGALAAGGHRLE